MSYKVGGNKHRATDVGTGSVQEARFARDEEEAVFIANQEKRRRKVGRREQREEQAKAKITLPRLKFLEKPE